MNFTSRISPYYGMYVVLGFVFKLVAKVLNVLKLYHILETKFGNSIIGIYDNRPKETAPRDSVSKTEIDHLATLANIWWDKKDKARMLHTFYQVRVPLVVEGLAETGRISKADITKPDALKGVRILDVGCGGGILAEDLARLGAYVVGLDPGREMINLAKRHLEIESPELKDNLEYHTITVEDHAKKFAGTYDAVVCSEVVEHVDEKEPILEACCRCLKSGGSLFVTTENQTMLAWFMFIIMEEYILRYIPKNTHFYEKFVSPGIISRIVGKFGCETRRVRGFIYDKIFNTWNFINDVDCNYGLHAVKN